MQGSYANKTNIRSQSDVDIAVVQKEINQEEVFKARYRNGITATHYNFSKAPTLTKPFKEEVEECLRENFGSDVERGNKSIKINGSTYRKDADVVPCMRCRDYRDDYDFDEDNYVAGIAITSDSGEIIYNYPEQHLANGAEKNNNTNHYYKRMVRIIKNMQHAMKEAVNPSAWDISSFGLESLLWNIPDNVFCEYQNQPFLFAFANVVNYLSSNTSLIRDFKEINGVQLLYPSTLDIRKCNNFIKALKGFYQY